MHVYGKIFGKFLYKNKEYFKGIYSNLLNIKYWIIYSRFMNQIFEKEKEYILEDKHILIFFYYLFEDFKREYFY